MRQEKQVLFLTWDGSGLTYLESLFIPIFIKLREKGYMFHVLQFTWGKESHGIIELCKSNGIKYSRINVTRKPSIIFGSILTVYRIVPKIKRYIKEHKIDILMPRSTFPLIVALRIKRKQPKLKLVYDADGLAIDERVEFAALPSNSLTYKILRNIEYNGLHKADIVLCRTEKAKEILYARAGGGIKKEKIHLVSNGRDEILFNIKNDEAIRRLKTELSIKESNRVLIYVGSVGNQYHVDEMLAFLEFCNRYSETKLIFLTSNMDYVKSHLENYPRMLNKIILKSVPFEEVPNYINCADIGLAFRTPSFSMQAVSPIKIGEYLLCGKPVISTPGIGDTEEIIESTKCGLLINKFDEESFNKVLNKYRKFTKTQHELRSVGLKFFGIKSTVEQYDIALKS